MIGVREEGDVAASGDERVMNYTYAVGTAHWMVNKLSSAKTYDPSGVKMKESLLYYDNLGLNGVGSKGALMKKEEWNNAGNNSVNTFSYDSYGNVKRQTDSLGNTLSYTYDYTSTFPVSTVNALGHVTLYSYDLGTGNLFSTQKNGIQTYYTYDTFWRVSKEVQPLDSLWYPTKSYVYNFDGVAPENIVVTLKTTTSNKSNVIRYYYDGFGQLVQLKNDIEDNRQVVKTIYYDGLGRVKAEENPYFAVLSSNISASLGSLNTTYSYDALDRVVGVRNADGTSKNITYNRWNVTDSDENGNRIQYTLDGFGQISNVTENYNDPFIFVNESYVTSYRYDTNGNLIRIMDSLGNVFSFKYDSLGRKISMDDPDLGHWVYKYDQNGNLIFQSGGGGNLVSGDGYYREYDGNGRLQKVRSGNIASGALLEEYSYDQDGIRIKVVRNDSANTKVYTPFPELLRVVNTTGSYDFVYVYQEGQLVARKNPDGTKLFMHGDAEGSTSTVTNSSGGIVENTSYSPYGEILSGGSNRFDYEGKEYSSVVGDYDFNL